MHSYFWVIEEMKHEELRAIVEALLFASDAPLTLAKMRSIVPGAAPGDIEEVLDDLAQEYETAEHSFQLLRVAKGYQLYTRREFADWVTKLYRGRRPARLSRAALETLSIIAYRQPVTRSTIEAIRGVESQTVLSTLLERSLIRVAGRSSGVGRPLIYETTGEFLRYFGLRDLSDLPEIGEFERALGVRQEEGIASTVRLSRDMVQHGDETEQVSLPGGSGIEEEVRSARQGGESPGERESREPSRADDRA